MHLRPKPLLLGTLSFVDILIIAAAVADHFQRSRPRLNVEFEGFTNGLRSGSFILANTFNGEVSYWVATECESGRVWTGPPPGTVLHHEERQRLAEKDSVRLTVPVPTGSQTWRLTVFYSYQDDTPIRKALGRLLRSIGFLHMAENLSGSRLGSSHSPPISPTQKVTTDP